MQDILKILEVNMYECMQKITYLGKDITPHINPIGRYKKMNYYPLVFAAIVGLIPLTLYTNSRVTAMVDKTPEPVIRMVDMGMYAKKIDSLKVEVVNEIAQCETGVNYTQDDGIIKYDNNSRATLTGKNIPSIGVMQYKIESVQRHYRSLFSKDLNNYDAILLALDVNRSKALAKDAIFKLGAVKEWSCANREIQVKVDVIKSFDK